MCLACETHDAHDPADAGSLDGPALTRRSLLVGLGGFVGGATLFAAGPSAPLAATRPPDRTLRLFRYHSGETLTATYFEDGRYSDAALKKINALCRDLLENEKTAMDVRLLDYLHAVSAACDPGAVIEIVSAYRSPKTNAFLRAKSSNVAKTSKHMEGRAIDVRIRGVEPGKVAEAAVALKRGGVGLYQSSGFVHLDTGKPRHWLITPEQTRSARVIQLRPRPRPGPPVAAAPRAMPEPAPALVRARPTLKPL